jgi:hypothetical protein
VVLELAGKVTQVVGLPPVFGVVEVVALVLWEEVQ